jgi:hypothetical protein
MHVYIIDTNTQDRAGEISDVQKHIDIETCMRRREEFALGASACEEKKKKKSNNKPQT